MAILETYKLTKTYRDRSGIEDINLEVEEGAFFGLLGAERSGKTTLVRLLMNLLHPTSGGAAIFGADTRYDNGEKRCGIGYVPAEDLFTPNCSLKHYLRMSLKAYGSRADGEILDVCQLLDLDPKLRLRAMTPDERKCASIAAAILHKPKLLILDEPSLDLDTYQRSGVFQLLRDLNKQGTTIFFTTRSAEEVRRFCTHTAILGEGTILASGKVSEISALSTLKVTVSVAEDCYDFVRALRIRNFSTAGNSISFIYEEGIDRLLKQMSQFTVNSFSLSEATLDTVLFSLRERSGRHDV